MSEEAPAADWAQLVCVTDLEAPPFLIGKDKFTIGRAQGNGKAMKYDVQNRQSVLWRG